MRKRLEFISHSFILRQHNLTLSGQARAEGGDMTAFLGISAFILAVLLVLAVSFYFQAKGQVQAAQKETASIRQQANSALARYKSISDLEKYKEQLNAEIAEHKHSNLQLKQQISANQLTHADLVDQIKAVEETLEMQSFGFYQPKYDFEDSEHYSHQLNVVRDSQKQMVKSQEATHCPQNWTVEGSAAKGRKMIKEHSKLMLRAFNGECDAAVGKVKYNNVNNLESRINRSFEAINKLGESKSLWLTRDYLILKLQELYLVHEHREKVQEEREEQRRIKEEMREEEKALKELEKVKKDAEKEEKIKTKALKKAQQELADSQGEQTDRLKGIVDRLEAELKSALERKAKAIARAQLTRSGHIYVLSNIGSFGEGVYKIGMTRRLEPLDRVRELGDASVPFEFDVHAMIYSEDAPSLERTLHKHFDSKRVNKVNLRREFFRVTLDDIKKAVEKNFGVITYVTVPKAEQFRKTLSLNHTKAHSTNGDRELPSDHSVTVRSETN